MTDPRKNFRGSTFFLRIRSKDGPLKLNGETRKFLVLNIGSISKIKLQNIKVNINFYDINLS